MLRECLPVLLLGWMVATGASAAPRQEGTPAGRLSFIQYGVETLGALEIRQLGQDSHGFLWIGTTDGLLRYDGRRLEAVDLRGAFKFPRPYRLQAGREGDMWVVGVEGPRLWHAGRWLSPPPPPGELLDLVTDASGQAWAATDEGLFRDQGQGRFRPVEGWPGAGARGVWVDRQGQVYVLAANGVHRRAGDGSWRTWELGTRLPWFRLSLMGLDARGHLWMYGDHQLLRLELSTGALVDETGLVGDRWLNSADLSPEGVLWLGTTRGLFRVEPDGKASRVPEGPSFINAVLVDREGSVWMGGLGLYRLVGGGQWRGHTPREGLPGENIWSVRRDGAGVLWVGTDQGLARGTARGWEAVEQLPRSPILALEEAEGGLWVAGSMPGEVLHYEPRGGRVRRLPLVGGPGRERVYRLLREDTGVLWAGSSAGVFRALRGARHLERVDLPGPVADVFDMLRDARGRLWFSGAHGLAVLEDGVPRRVSSPGLRAPLMKWLSEGPEGRVCVTYYEALGVSCFRYERGEARDFIHLDTETGLTSNNIYTLRQDTRGRLWVGSARGVDLIEGGRVTHYGMAEGLPGENCNARAFWEDADGTVWLGTMTGLGAFRPGERAPVVAPPKVVLTAASLGEQALALEPGGAEVGWEGRTLELEWAAPTFAHGGQVESQVRLLGLEPQWRSEDFRARYVRLAPGSYEFQVRARHPRGPWGKTVSFQVTLLPPWWQTTGFRVALGLVGAGGLGLVEAWRRRAQRLRREELERQLRERTEELRQAQAQVLRMEKAATEERLAGGVAHEMRNVLSGAKMLLSAGYVSQGRSLCEENGARLEQFFLRAREHLPPEERRALAVLLKELNGNEEKLDTVLREVDAALARALRTTHLMLDYARMMKDEPGAEPVGVRALVEAVLGESRQDLAAQGIEVEVEVEAASTLQCREEHLYPVLSNLVRNARDALAQQVPPARRRLRVSFRTEGGQPVLQVEDTGVGIAPEALPHIFEPFFSTKARHGTGLGLSVVQRLVGLYGGKIEVDSTPGQGTCLTVRWPPAPGAGP